MKERWVQVRKFFHEFWWEMGRWILVLFLMSAGIATLILFWKFSTYPFIVYFGCFLGSVVGSWFYMFLRKPAKGEFAGDK